MRERVKITLILSVVVVAALTSAFMTQTLFEAPRGDHFPELPVNRRVCADGDFTANPSQEVVQVYMAAYQWKYSYCSITVYRGQKVVLHLKSLDVPHGFSIDGYPQVGNTLITPNQVTTISFETDEVGELVYFCTAFCGEGHPNHKGILIVR